jgi:hypothetical protein
VLIKLRPHQFHYDLEQTIYKDHYNFRYELLLDISIIYIVLIVKSTPVTLYYFVDIQFRWYKNQLVGSGRCIFRTRFNLITFYKVGFAVVVGFTFPFDYYIIIESICIEYYLFLEINLFHSIYSGCLYWYRYIHTTPINDLLITQTSRFFFFFCFCCFVF